MINYSISGKTLTVNGNRVDFEHDIKNTVEVDGLVVVMLWNMSTGNIQKQPFNNVYAVDENGKIIWNLKDVIGNDGLYTMLRLDEAKRLVAVEFIGMNYIIDAKNKQLVGGKAYK